MNILHTVGSAIRSLWSGNTEESRPRTIEGAHDHFVQSTDAIGKLNPEDPKTHSKLADYFNDPERHVRWAAVKAIAKNPEKIVDPEVIRATISLLNDADSEVKATSLKVLNKIPQGTLKEAISGIKNFATINETINSFSSNDRSSVVRQLLQHRAAEIENMIDSALH